MRARLIEALQRVRLSENITHNYDFWLTSAHQVFLLRAQQA